MHTAVCATRNGTGSWRFRRRNCSKSARSPNRLVDAEKRTNLSRRFIDDIFVRCSREAILVSFKSGERRFNPLEANTLLLEPQIFTKPVITPVIQQRFLRIVDARPVAWHPVMFFTPFRL